MTGAEHYREAERLAASVKDRDLATETIQAVATLAQVHATLAHAAATYDYDWNHAGEAAAS
jgi:hypothetical protein